MKKTSLWVAVSILAAACGGTATVAPPPVAKPLVAPVAKVSVCERTRPNTGPVRLDTRRQSGVVALAKVGDSTIAYVADSDDESLQTYDVDAGKLLAVTRLGAAPEHVLVLSDGRVAVTMRNQNRVQLLEPHADAAQPLTGLCSLRTPAEPVAMALTVDDSTLLVTSAFAHKLTGYNSLTGAKRFIQNLPREPRAVLVDDDGQRAFVAHVIGGHVSVVDLAENATEPVRQIDMRVPKLFGTTNNDPLRSSCQGFALAKSFMTRKPAAATHPALPGGHHAAATSPALALKVPSGRLFVPRVTIEGGDATQRTEGYGGDSVRQIEEPIVTVVDSLAERNMTRTVSDIAGTSGRCLLPRAAVVSGNSGSLLLTCLGSDTVVELDAGALDPSQSQRRQWPVPAGPTGLALDDNKGNAVVWSQFERRLSVLDLNSKESQITTVVAPRLSKHQDKAWAWGRALFHRTGDSRISGDGRACASCHPDGREDALTWSTPVGPRQTIMLAGRVTGNAPYSWLGTHKNLKEHVTRTFQRLGGSGLNDHPKGDSDFDALLHYVSHMPAPNLKGALVSRRQVKLAKRGKALFYGEEQGCSGCHRDGGADAKQHDVVALGSDAGVAFNTPSLRFVGGTAPYFHDGRYATLQDMLRATDSKMGHTMQLSYRDTQALVAFMETL